MSQDPLQALIAAGAIPASPYTASSRYRGVAIATYTGADGRSIAYGLRRLIAPRREIAIVAHHVVQGGERPDLLAHATYGDALLDWRIADANAVIDPAELTDTLGAVIALPVPPAGA